jgi:hypothetical protein
VQQDNTAGDAIPNIFGTNLSLFLAYYLGLLHDCDAFDLTLGYSAIDACCYGAYAIRTCSVIYIYGQTSAWMV